MSFPWRIVILSGVVASFVQRVLSAPGREAAASKERKRIAQLMKRTPSEYADVQITFEESYMTNARGMALYTTMWSPTEQNPKALIFLLHGYGVECSIFWADTGLKLAQQGYAVFGIDYEGHGESEGLQAYIPDMEKLVDDVTAHTDYITGRHEYAGLRKFLYGMSMGGAIALLVHRRQPDSWDGAVLLAPMCKIAESVKPPAFVTAILRRLAYLFPTLKLVPTKDITDLASKNGEYKKKIRKNPFLYQENPRIGTAITLLTTTDSLESRLNEVCLPFLLLHGEDDAVTDPSVSAALFESAESKDKTLKLYPGMWHSLTEGDSEEACDAVWKDIFVWLSEHTKVESEASQALASPLPDIRDIPSPAIPLELEGVDREKEDEAREREADVPKERTLLRQSSSFGQFMKRVGSLISYEPKIGMQSHGPSKKK